METVWLALGIFGLCVWVAATLVLVSSTIISVGPHPRARRVAIPQDLPSIALIRPIAGVEYRMREVTLSALTQDHPGIEIVLAVSSGDDPALPLIRDLHATFPDRSRIVFGERRAHANPKLANMAGGVRGLRAEFLFFSDGNTLLDPDSARRWQAQALACGGVVSAPPEGIEPGTLAAWTECAFLNQHHLRLVLMLDLMGVPTVHGKAMIASAENFVALGGIEALARFPAEDFAMAQAARTTGIPVRVSDMTARTPLGPRTWRAMLGRQKRWAQLRAASAPASLVAEFAVLMLPSGIAGALASASIWDFHPAAFLSCHILLWLVSDLFVAGMRNQVVGLWTPLASLIREFLAPGILLAGLLDSRIEWGGQIVGAKPPR